MRLLLLASLLVSGLSSTPTADSLQYVPPTNILYIHLFLATVMSPSLAKLLMYFQPVVIKWYFYFQFSAILFLDSTYADCGSTSYKSHGGSTYEKGDFCSTRCASQEIDGR